MYLLAQIEGAKKPQLYKVKQNGATYNGVLVDHTRWSGDTFTIKAREVILYLGENPPIGNVYDCWIEPVVRRIDVKGYGEVYFFKNVDDKVQERISRSLVNALKFVRDLGPQCDWEMRTEVRHPKSVKLMGMYKYKSKGTDVLIHYDQEGLANNERMTTNVHELGHGVWYRYLTADERSDWIELYDRYVEEKTISPQQIKNMIKDIRQLGSIRDYGKSCEPEEAAGLAIFTGWLSKVHNMSRHSFQDLLTSNGKIPIPDTHLHRSETQTPVTLYSKTSAEELFCEAIGSYAIGSLENKTMRKMLKSLR